VEGMSCDKRFSLGALPSLRGGKESGMEGIVEGNGI